MLGHSLRVPRLELGGELRLAAFDLRHHLLDFLGVRGRNGIFTLRLAALQAFAAFGEFLGGFALIGGLLTPAACVVLLGIMGGAMATVHLPNGSPFVASPGRPSCETVVVYSAASLLFLLCGPGRFSADAFLFRPAVPRKPKEGAIFGSGL